MPIPAAVLTAIRVTGAVYTTYKLAKAAIDALDSQTDKDYFDPEGHQTIRFIDYDTTKFVGIVGGHWSMKSQEIPENPRGQIAAHFVVVLNRDAVEGTPVDPATETMTVTLLVSPSWWNADEVDWIDLPSGTITVKVPAGASTFEGAIHLDARQAFFKTGTQLFDLTITVQSPSDPANWTNTSKQFRFQNYIDSEGQRFLKGNFDYFHMPFE